MPSAETVTLRDVIEELTDFLGSNADEKVRRACFRAAQQALRELYMSHDWSIYYDLVPINTVASYSTGTVSFDLTGGAYERLVTLSGGTWPSYAARATIQLESVLYRVETRESDTEITLSPLTAPAADIASGTTYSLFQDTYRLPLNFGKLKGPFIDSATLQILKPVHPDYWMRETRVFHGPGTPGSFCIMGHDDFMGSMSVRFTPPPGSARTYEAVMLRRPRRLQIEDDKDGTISVTADSTAVTGTGTAFADKHIGSVLRRSSSSTALTNIYGSNPWAEERIIVDVASATAATVDEAWDTTASGVAYSISDPLDIDVGIMLNLYLRTAEKLLAGMRQKADYGQIAQAWQMELANAKGADNRIAGARQVGGMGKVDYMTFQLAYGRFGGNANF